MNSVSQTTSYDKIPYESRSYPQSHPDRLATLGRLFGMNPAPITKCKCRVLEMGCASGGNLIPMAYHIPESEFIGIDLSMSQVKLGQKIIQDLGLKNIRIVHGNIMDINSSWGLFDYIICHGVYSWVSDEVQEKILSVASKNLTPQGIAYISYNTYPGWHIREMIRHIMLYHANQFEEPNERIGQARAFMDFLARSIAKKDTTYNLLLQNELNLIQQSQDWYLFHDHLEEVNVPIYFYQFVERAERHGLQYLGEAEFSTMLTSGFPKEISTTLERISPDIIHAEQYMDFLRNRLFRQTLLCHKEISLKRNLGTESIEGLWIASNVYPETGEVDLTQGKKQTFRSSIGSTVETDFPLTKSALWILKRYWPRAIDFEHLLWEANESLGGNFLNEGDHEKLRALAEDLLHCYAANIVELHTWQANFISHVTKQPKVSSLAAYQIEHHLPVTNQRHEVVQVDSLTKQIILTLDGTNDRKEIIHKLLKQVEEGSLVIHQDGNTLNDKEQIQNILIGALEQTLVNLCFSAMLIDETRKMSINEIIKYF